MMDSTSTSELKLAIQAAYSNLHLAFANADDSITQFFSYLGCSALLELLDLPLEFYRFSFLFLELATSISCISSRNS